MGEADTVKIKIGKVTVPIKVDADIFDCETEEELQAVIHASYGDDVGHFLEENLPDSVKFVWSKNFTEAELDKLAKDYYSKRDLEEEL